MTSPPGGRLDADQQRAWLAFMRLHLRMAYEMNRRLHADTTRSLSDYHVLTALDAEPAAAMSVTALAAAIGWERSRASHHTKRMSARGLVEMRPAAHDRRVTDVSPTDSGRAAPAAAAPGHVEPVRNLFFDGLPPALVSRLAEPLEAVYGNVLERGTLPRV
ncbi:MarR family winged helix-turn-helix transcriptional regulator [Pseudonocardia xishanensis]|uniref:MarR family winged helix-turn-helix transcriptional regulator n=1 Tax=Pseudonocardia xishanensis TaxID=630995 RepID=A0ABP8RN07_9PSEU